MKNDSKKIWEDWTFPNSLYEVNITLILKTAKEIIKKSKLPKNIPYEPRCQNPQQNTSKLNYAAYLKYYVPWPSGIYPRNAGCST